MGQYHITINLDKREFINPHKIGLGLKLLEQCGMAGSSGDVLVMLLACSNGRGGGDISTKYPGMIGRWAGDRIAVVGDYCQEDDISGVNIRNIRQLCRNPGEVDPKLLTTWGSAFKDISDDLIPLINEQFDCHLDPAEGGWRKR